MRPALESSCGPFANRFSHPYVAAKQEADYPCQPAGRPTPQPDKIALTLAFPDQEPPALPTQLRTQSDTMGCSHCHQGLIPGPTTARSRSLSAFVRPTTEEWFDAKRYSKMVAKERDVPNEVTHILCTDVKP